MVRWRGCLILMVLLLVPLTIQYSERDESTEEGDVEEESNNSNEDEDGNEDNGDEPRQQSPVTKKPTTTIPVSRTTTKPPLDCYTCAFKNDMPLRSCLDPTFNRVHVVTCDNVDDKCFTKVMNQVNNDFEAVIRGCKSQCETTMDTKCCETSRCNNETFLRPIVQPKSAIKIQQKSSSKSLAPNIVLFVTTLLILQTIGKAAFSDNL